MEESLRKMMNAQLIVELSNVGAVTSGKKSALIDRVLAYHQNNNFVGPLANIPSWAFIIFLSDSSILLLFLGLKFYPLWRPNSELCKSFFFGITLAIIIVVLNVLIKSA